MISSDLYSCYTYIYFYSARVVSAYASITSMLKLYRFLGKNFFVIIHARPSICCCKKCSCGWFTSTASKALKAYYSYGYIDENG